jgi:hypothetical protein
LLSANPRRRLLVARGADLAVLCLSANNNTYLRIDLGESNYETNPISLVFSTNDYQVCGSSDGLRELPWHWEPLAGVEA